MADEVLQKVLVGSLVAIVSAAIAWAWLKLSHRGQSIWSEMGKRPYGREMAALTCVALVLAVTSTALVLFRARPLQIAKSDIFYGEARSATRAKDDPWWSAAATCGAVANAVAIGALCDTAPGSEGSLIVAGTSDGIAKCTWRDTKPEFFNGRVRPVCLKVRPE